MESDAPVEVAWAGPDAPRDRARLDAPCRILGPVAVRLAPGPAPASAVTVVVSWNMYLGRGDIAGLVRDLRDGRFTGAPVGAFVLLIQEAYRSSILEFARASNLSVVFAPERRRPFEGDDRGAAILATFPIARILVIELPFEARRRIAVAARIEGRAPDGPWALQVVNIHFDTAVGFLRGGPGAVRKRQAQALVDVVRDLPSPTIVAGDLNTWWGDDEPAVKELREAFPDARPLRARDTWRGPLGVGNKLDYLFARGFRPPLSVQRLASRYGSDHWPLLSAVEVR